MPSVRAKRPASGIAWRPDLPWGQRGGGAEERHYRPRLSCIGTPRRPGEDEAIHPRYPSRPSEVLRRTRHFPVVRRALPRPPRPLSSLPLLPPSPPEPRATPPVSPPPLPSTSLRSHSPPPPLSPPPPPPSPPPSLLSPPPCEPKDSLVVQSQTKADIDRFVALLDEGGGKRHEVQAVGGRLPLPGRRRRGRRLPQPSLGWSARSTTRP